MYLTNNPICFATWREPSKKNNSGEHLNGKYYIEIWNHGDRFSRCWAYTSSPLNFVIYTIHRRCTGWEITATWRRVSLLLLDVFTHDKIYFVIYSRIYFLLLSPTARFSYGVVDTNCRYSIVKTRGYFIIIKLHLAYNCALYAYKKLLL